MAGRQYGRAGLIPCVLALALLMLPGHAMAGDGDLDPSFAGDGTFERDLSPGASGEGASNIFLDAQGRILATGTAFGQGTQLARFLSDGSLDPSFDDDGLSYFNLPDRSLALDSALLGGDRVALGGFIDFPPDFDAFAGVVNAGGDLDPTFGNDPPEPVGDGIVRFDPGPGDENQFAAVDVDSQGRLVLAGRTGTNITGGANDILLSRTLADGSPDPAFGTGTIVKNLGTDDRAYDVLALADKVLVVALTDGQYVLMRLNSDGSPDLSFDSDGILPIPGFTSSDAESAQLALAPDGSVVMLAPLGSFPNWRAGLARLTPAGALDAGFGDGGSTIIESGQRSLPETLAVGDDGRIVFGVNVRPETTYHGTIRRLNADGRIDQGFGSNGVVTLPDRDVVSGVAVAPDRRILVAGGAFPTTDTDASFLVGRLLGDTVAPDTAITKAKKKVRAGKRAKLEFAAVGDVNTSFECALKKPKKKRRQGAKPPKFADCSSPSKTKRLKRPGKYRFFVRAIDPAGNVDATPASKRLKVKPKRR